MIYYPRLDGEDAVHFEIMDLEKMHEGILHQQMVFFVFQCPFCEKRQRVKLLLIFYHQMLMTDIFLPAERENFLVYILLKG